MDNKTDECAKLRLRRPQEKPIFAKMSDFPVTRKQWACGDMEIVCVRSLDPRGAARPHSHESYPRLDHQHNILVSVISPMIQQPCSMITCNPITTAWIARAPW